MNEREFQGWPKIARLRRDIIVTEKIDGTNAAVVITDDGDVYAQSRTRVITPVDDNFGFARWVEENKEELRLLGPGRHFGEWWGPGIQRGYGLAQKRFSLFNVDRWGDQRPACCSAVPVLYRGEFDSAAIDRTLGALAEGGSVASPGFMRPEGIIVYHTAARQMFKRTIEKDDEPKGKQ